MEHTYTVSTVSSVLDLCLVEFHLLLLQKRLDLRVFFLHYNQQVFRESFRTLYLLLVWTAVVH